MLVHCWYTVGENAVNKDQVVVATIILGVAHPARLEISGLPPLEGLCLRQETGGLRRDRLYSLAKVIHNHEKAIST